MCQSGAFQAIFDKIVTLWLFITIVSSLNIDESLLKLCNSRLYSLSFIFNPMTLRKQGQAKTKNENLAIEPAERKKKEKT